MFSKKIKDVLPKIIKSESVRLTSDILEVSKTLNIDSYIMTVDIEKALDYVDHTFLYSCLKRFGFNNSFIKWIKVLYEKQESWFSMVANPLDIFL